MKTGKNYLIDSKLKSHYKNIIINPSDKKIYFFKYKNNFCNINNMKISDILPKGIELTQYSVEYYYLLKNLDQILSINEFIDICTNF